MCRANKPGRAVALTGAQYISWPLLRPITNLPGGYHYWLH